MKTVYVVKELMNEKYYKYCLEQAQKENFIIEAFLIAFLEEDITYWSEVYGSYLDLVVKNSFQKDYRGKVGNHLKFVRKALEDK